MITVPGLTSRGLLHAAQIAPWPVRRTGAKARQCGQRLSSPKTLPQPGHRFRPGGISVPHVGHFAGISDVAGVAIPGT
jgi:hypothetical protein